MKLIITGFLQVFFVSLNTFLIANGKVYIVPFVSFMISFIWSFNVKKVAFGSMRDRVVYSIGARIGGISGLLMGGMI